MPIPTWNPRDLSGTPLGGLRPGDPGWDSHCADAVVSGSPDLVMHPTTAAEVAEVLSYAGAKHIPVTATGGYTGVTGAAVAENGIALSTQRLAGIVDMDLVPATGQGRVVVRPGTVLGDVERSLRDQGWMYPPDPTSRNQAFVGGTVATNATGEDSLQYGPTRQWVQAVEFVDAAGSIRRLTREHAPPPEAKATAGYFTRGEPIDLLIGSEGTLGILTELTLRVVPRPSGILAGLAFFPDVPRALDFVLAARASSAVTPRALELLDRASLDLVVDNPEGITWPESTGAAVGFKAEIPDPRDADQVVDAWLQCIESALAGDPAGKALAQATVAVLDRPGRQRLRSFRHRVPATLHEKVAGFGDQGGAKVGTDWWVPLSGIHGMLDKWQTRLAAAMLEFVIFGHIGNGHPHVNMLARNAAETAVARDLALAMCRDAVSLGGGVAGEHGLGKLKRDLLAVQYPDGVDAMRSIKTAWDPHWILGRGNLFLPEVS